MGVVEDRRVEPFEAVSALLVAVEGLDADLSLDALARTVGLSPFQFHRRFRRLVGETPKRHVARLRIERAAQLLSQADERIVNVGLAVGFNNHETFCRAFRRAHGCSPSAYRKQARATQRRRIERNQGFAGHCCALSEVRFEFLPARRLVAVRRLGAYADFRPAERQALWDELIDWARAQGAPWGGERICLFPDDPLLTPGPLQACDVCLPVAAAPPAGQRLRGLEVEGGLHAVIDHLGPPRTAIQAYRAVADGVRRSGRYELRDSAPLQIFEASGPDGDLERSRICFAVRKSR